MKKRLIALLLVFTLLIPAAVASAATWYRVNTTSLKVRMLPGENTKVLGSYRRDYAATVSSSRDGWSYVVFSNGFEGYVMSKYLSKGSSYKAWVTNDNTALRKGPDGGFSSIAVLARGKQVTVLSHGARYDYVKAGDLGTGYVVNSRLSKKKVKASGSASYSTVVSGSNYTAYVMNAGDRKVNFRSQPSKSSAVIAQYPSGTPVYVLAHGEVWDKIEIGGVQGWMMTQYLTTSAPAPTPTQNPTVTDSASYYTAYVVSDNQKGVHARKGKSTNYTVLFTVPYGAPVAVLEHNTVWDYIQYNGKKGYMNNQFLQLAKPANAPAITTLDPSVTPTPTPKFEPYTTTVNVDQLNFHQQKGDWSSNVHKVGRLNKGDVVTVLEISGKWAHIEYNGYKGWVHKEFLN